MGVNSQECIKSQGVREIRTKKLLYLVGLLYNFMADEYLEIALLLTTLFSQESTFRAVMEAHDRCESRRGNYFDLG